MSNKKEVDRDEWFLPEDKDKYEKYLRGADDDEPAEAKTFQLQRELANHHDDVIKAARGAVRSEMLQTTEAGYIEAPMTQKEITKEIPVAVASRKFDFQLPNGPYRADITLNGRSILLGGQGGHVASFDWYKGTKYFEIYPNDEIRDVTFLFDDTMSAMATRKTVYIHDKNGVQLHELLDHKSPLFLQFLRQHWLLVSASENGRLSYSDITDGKTVARIRTKRGAPSAMTHNRHTGVVALGHANGVVSFWTPNMEEPAATIFAHPSPLTALDVNIAGDKLVTAGCDGSVRVWDMRSFEKCYSKTNDKYAASDVAFSATGVLGTARGARVEFFRGLDAKKPFLAHMFGAQVRSLKFVMFDDFAICGLDNGISSVVVPGSGEPNIDSNVANPFATARWRQEQEVRGLLDKIPYDMITMDADGPFKVGRPVDKQKQRAEKLEKYRISKQPDGVKASGTKEKRVSLEKRLQMMKEEYHKQQIEQKMEQIQKEKEGKAPQEPQGPLRRFAKAKKKFDH